MNVPRVLPTHDVILAGLLHLHTNHQTHLAVDLLMYLLGLEIQSVASPRSIRELTDHLVAKVPTVVVEDFLRHYPDLCHMVSLQGTVKTGPRGLRLTVEAARVGKVDALVALDEQIDDEPSNVALRSSGRPVVALSESPNVIMRLITAARDDTDDRGQLKTTGTEYGKHREAERAGALGSWKAALDAENLLTAEKELARLIPVPELPYGFDHTGWRHLDSGHSSDEQVFACEIVGRIPGRTQTITVTRKLSVRDSMPETEAFAESLYGDFVKAIELIRLRLNVIP